MTEILKSYSSSGITFYGTLLLSSMIVILYYLKLYIVDLSWKMEIDRSIAEIINWTWKMKPIYYMGKANFF